MENPALVDPMNAATIFNNRGVTFYEMNRFEEALASYDQAIALKSDDAEFIKNRGNALIKLKRFQEAIADFEKSKSLKSDQPYLEGLRLHAKMHICDWNDFDGDCASLISKIETGVSASEPFILLPIPMESALHRKCAELYVADICSAALSPLWRGERYAHQRIRVAYLSADFREHAVATLAAGLFDHHDKSRFETTAISLGPDTKDIMRRRLQASFGQFIDASTKSDREVATLLRDLEIDIAVDLNGFTGDARSNIFALRAAPVQVNYLGYAGTLGKNYWDYIVEIGRASCRERV